MPDVKTFRIDVAGGVVAPALHRVSLAARDQVRWVLNDGNGRLVFDPTVGDPLLWSHGPDFDWQDPALGAPKTTGTFLHTISYWYDLGLGGNKQHESLQAVLIIDP